MMVVLKYLIVQFLLLMENQFKDQIIIDGLQYCNWNRALFEDIWNGGLTAVHATIVYWENTDMLPVVRSFSLLRHLNFLKI